MLKSKIVIAFCFLVMVFSCTACAKNPLPEESDTVDAVFEKEYSTLDSIVTYLLSLEESTVYIEFDPVRIMGEHGIPMEFDDIEIECIVNELAEKGYGRIIMDDGLVKFSVWRRSFYPEFDAGFVYSDEGTVDFSNVSFLTFQRPLSIDNWYYYEADYNEWRVRNTEE